MKINEIDNLIKQKLKVFDEIDKMIFHSPSKETKINSFQNDEINKNSRIIINNIQLKDNKNSINIKNYNYSNNNDIDSDFNQIQKNSENISINNVNLDKIKTILKNKNRDDIQVSPQKIKSLNTIKSVNEKKEDSGKKDEKVNKHSPETNQSNNSVNHGIWKSPSLSTLKMSESRNTLLCRSYSSNLFNDLNYDITEKPNCKKENCERNKYFFDFIPILNKNSLEIAEKLGSSFDRLTRMQKKSKSTKNDSFSNLSFISNYSKVSKLSYNDKTLGHSLYNRAVISQRKKKQMINSKSIEDEQSFQQYSYSPDLSLSKSIKRYKSQDEGLRERIYEREL